MTTLRDHWLEALSACVTAALVAIVYTVLVQYEAGPPLGLRQVSALAALPATAGPPAR